MDAPSTNALNSRLNKLRKARVGFFLKLTITETCSLMVCSSLHTR